jgi:hypothetical protein
MCPCIDLQNSTYLCHVFYYGELEGLTSASTHHIKSSQLWLDHLDTFLFDHTQHYECNSLVLLSVGKEVVVQTLIITRNTNFALIQCYNPSISNPNMVSHMANSSGIQFYNSSMFLDLTLL